MRSRIALACLIPLLGTSCATSRRAPVAAPLPVAEAPAAVPMPQPPSGAAPNQRVPARLADGSYATPNRDLSPAATLWHLRAALNVAALGCDDAGRSVSAAYNQLLTRNRRVLAEAHREVAREHTGAGSFDAAMTRLYNYYSQPPAQPGFCAAARSVLAEAASLPADGLTSIAAEALVRVDRPFTDFYASYDRYRADLAAWQAGGSVQPRLAYDPSVLMADQSVTGGRTQMAGR